VSSDDNSGVVSPRSLREMLNDIDRAGSRCAIFLVDKINKLRNSQQVWPHGLDGDRDGRGCSLCHRK
jgi:hypothetical protein